MTISRVAFATKNKVWYEGQNISTKADCLSYPGNRWRNQRYNFDNLGQALMSLFVLASKDGWVDIMYNGLDAVAVDTQVEREDKVESY